MNIDRINFLAKKSREIGLTEEEQQEQKILRKEYIENFKSSLRQQLDQTYIVDEQGNKTKLEPKN